MPCKWTTACRFRVIVTQISARLFEEIRAEMAASLASQLARNRYVGRFGTVNRPELTGIIERILDHYGKWAEGEASELAACLDFVENLCFALSIPLAETAYALYVLRDGIVSTLSDANEAESSEMIRQVSIFFDRLVVELLRRY